MLFYKWVDWGTGKLGNLSTLTELVNVAADQTDPSKDYTMYLLCITLDKFKNI